MDCQFLGLAAGPATYGGNSGPLTFVPNAKIGEGVALFRMREDHSGDVQAMALRMEAFAQGRLPAAAQVEPDEFDFAARLGRKVAQYLRDDGRFSGAELADLVAELAKGTHVDQVAQHAAESLIARLVGMLGDK